MREVFWVTRAKENLQFEVVESYRSRRAARSSPMNWSG